MKGEGGVILSFDEGPSRFKANMLPFGWDFSKLENEKKVMINHVKPLQVEQFAKQEGIIIGEMISSMNAKRVFLDSITPFEMMFEREYDRRLYVSRLLEEVHKYGCTLIISSETSGKELSKFGEIEYIVDGIIKLELDPHEVSYSRTLTILKMRGLEHYVGGIPFKVTKEGVRVLYEKG
jgi:circadian clock protein KaiC